MPRKHALTLVLNIQKGHGVQVVCRTDIADISSIDVLNVRHELGIVKDFHKHEVLAQFVPELARLSLSWVHLDPGQELAPHSHPTKSMIVVAEGNGLVQGDVTGEIQAGDIVVVPEGAHHGFVGAGPLGFWALSVQFEGSGLYEDAVAPRVSFGDASDITLVTAENERFMASFECTALVEMARSCDGSAPGLTSRLLDELQPWSDEFQRIIAQRAAAECDPGLRQLAHGHLREELGHNDLLAQFRQGRSAGDWDPVIAAAASWFIDRMSSGSSVERTVLAHLVLEGSALVFHQVANPHFAGNEYFSLHDASDAEHLDMGYRALAARSDWTAGQVTDILRQGWAMMTVLCDRIAENVSSWAADTATGKSQPQS